MHKSKIVYAQKLPNISDFSNSAILFYDKNTAKHSFVKTWINQFKYKIALNAGESLKDLKSYSQNLEIVQNLVLKNSLGGSELTFVALGGGSVGDFVGFLASTYQRGRKLISIPSTWLAAIDSAHGGKNGLNLNQIKNQIGTFYPADTIYICQNILSSLPQASLNDSFSEALKICIINQPQLFFKLQKTSDSLFKNLPQLIKGKLKVVESDPFESRGLRKVLNLGHTMGHVFESHYKLSHGQAVFFGLLFTLRWSLNKKIMTWDEFQFLSEKLFSIETEMNYQQVIQIPKKKVHELLAQDKKKTSKSKLDFIFIKELGKTIKKSVEIEEIIIELLRQQKEL